MRFDGHMRLREESELADAGGSDSIGRPPPPSRWLVLLRRLSLMLAVGGCALITLWASNAHPEKVRDQRDIGLLLLVCGLLLMRLPRAFLGQRERVNRTGLDHLASIRAPVIGSSSTTPAPSTPTPEAPASPDPKA